MYSSNQKVEEGEMRDKDIKINRQQSDDNKARYFSDCYFNCLLFIFVYNLKNTINPVKWFIAIRIHTHTQALSCHTVSIKYYVI